MKIVEFGKAAADAELLLLKKKSIRVSRQILLCCIGAVFGLFVLISLHAVLAALCCWLFHIGFLGSSLIILIFDILCAGIFFYLALQAKIGEEEIEAKVIRNHNLKQLRDSIALTTLITALTGPLGGYLRSFIWQFIKKKFRKKSE